MTEIATIDWFGRWGTCVFSENTAIFRNGLEKVIAKRYLASITYKSENLAFCRRF